MKANRKLKDLIALSCNVKVYVPSTANVSDYISESARERIVENALKFLGELFGGATAYQALGSWVSQNEGLVKEKVTICESFCDSAALDNHIEKVITFCEMMKSEMGQEAIALEVNNVLHFV